MRELSRRQLLDRVARLAGPAVAAAALPARAKDAAVRIGWLRGPNDLTLARARGTLEAALPKAGASVQWAGPFPAAAPALQALTADAIDLTVGSSTASITALAAGVPLVVFGYQKMSPGSEGIVVKSGSPIRSVADLAGRRVAVNRGGTGEYLLMRALATHKVDAAAVTRIYLPPSASSSAFASDHVDAWATWDPFLSIALANGDARCLADGAQIGSDNAVTLLASRDFVRDRRAVLDAVFEALQADDRWATQNSAQAGAIWCREMGLAASLADRIGANNATPTRAVTEADIAQMEQIAQWYADSRLIPSKPDLHAGVVRL